MWFIYPFPTRLILWHWGKSLIFTLPLREMDKHYGDVIMSAMVFQMTSLVIVCSNVYSGTDQRKHQSSASLAFHWNSPVTDESPTQRPVTRKMFPFHGFIMKFTGSKLWHKAEREQYAYFYISCFLYLGSTQTPLTWFESELNFISCRLYNR